MRWDSWRGSIDGRPTLWTRHLVRIREHHLDIHKMVAADDADCFHTHPALSFRLVLWGGYTEELEDGAIVKWRPGMFGIVRPEFSHRISGLLNGHVS